MQYPSCRGWTRDSDTYHQTTILGNVSSTTDRWGLQAEQPFSPFCFRHVRRKSSNHSLNTSLSHTDLRSFFHIYAKQTASSPLAVSFFNATKSCKDSTSPHASCTSISILWRRIRIVPTDEGICFTNCVHLVTWISTGGSSTP